MRSEAECIPCVIHQCQRVIRLVTSDEERLLSITHRVLDRIQELTLDEPPSRFTTLVLLEVYAALGCDDPFARVKDEMNELGSRAVEKARARVEHSADPLHTAILYAAAGNVIDSGPQASFDLDAALTGLHFRHDDYQSFRDRLHGASTILYLLDNAGEVFFDRLLLERLAGFQLTLAVKPAPILNDATIHDAQAAGLAKFGPVITTGTRALGVDLNEASPEFRTAFGEADIIIAKGHANFESVIDLARDTFFVLKAKCPVVAQRLTGEVRKRAPVTGAVGDAFFLYSEGRADDV
jgi:uncharacterized protein with ATP-grasp and redox domains